MFKILIAEPTYESLLFDLQEAGFICEYKPEISFEELKSIIRNYNGLVIRSKFKIDKDFLDLSDNLQFIARAGAGMENIDEEYATSKNIVCINSPEGNRNAVGEHALGMLLTLFAKISISNNEIRNGIWNRKNIGYEIEGKTVAIIGYGNMGGTFARKLQGFNANIIAYDKYKQNYSDKYAKQVNLDEVFEKADILSFHVPLTEETEFMFNENFIQKFKKNIFVINTSRGKVVKTSDLVENLKSGKIQGAMLDVLEYEKSSFENIFASKNNEDFNYLINAQNVILTPHIAGSTEESYKKIARVLTEKIISNFVLKLSK